MKFLLLAVAMISASAVKSTALTRYVDLNSPSPTPPYTSWPTAATNIQDAIDAAVDGDLVLVTNGVYRTGGRVVFGAMTNRVAVTKPIILQSVNGASVTAIEGKSPSGVNAVRCVYLTNQAQLIGFTLTNGASLASGDNTKERSGGGVWCEPLASPASLVPVISNCVIIANSASQDGGGGYNGSYVRCILRGNTASLGGGARNGYFQNCLILGNTAFTAGGGLDFPTSASNCTIVSNVCESSIGAGGVTIGGFLRNCIIYYNTNANLAGSFRNYSGSSIQVPYCNTITIPPTISGTAFTNAPLFVNSASGDFRLQPDSACINAGNNANVVDSVDLQGLTRIVSGTVDVGAYEFQSSTSTLSYQWAQRFGLPTDGSADFTDADTDGMNNYGEWRSDTIPTNALSVLKMVNATNSPTGANVRWQSVSTRSYWLERATNLGIAAPFQSVATNIFGVPGTKTFTDTSATNGGPYFYRVGVQ